ncbi:MAG TPA: 50S ribosomal protein L29 [Ktedonobacterales bacterium]|nr:50S ribosomal protein L29 [Ktedonobacterales bacterium]
MSKRSERVREIRGMDMASAQKELDEKRKDLFMLRLRKERGDVKNNREFPQLKKEIARLLQHLTDLSNAEQLEASGALDEAEEAEAEAEPAEPVTAASATEGEE